MEIRHNEIKNKGAFFIEEDGERAAELLYFRAGPGQINIYHTEVGEKLRGSGVGRDLVAAAVKHARDNDLKIIASCPYTKKVMEAEPEYRELLIDE